MCLPLRRDGDQGCWVVEKGVPVLGDCCSPVPGTLRLGKYVVCRLRRLLFALLLTNGYGCKNCIGHRCGIQRYNVMIRLS